MEMLEKNNSLKAQANGLGINFDALEELAKVVIESGLSPLSTTKAVMIAVLQGRELGLPPMASINNIYDINGKATQSIHLMNGLALKNNVIFKILTDYKPIVVYRDGNQMEYPEEMVLQFVKEEKWSLIDSKYLKNQDVLAALPKDRKCIIRYTVDYVTTVEGTRKWSDGRVMTLPSSYYYSTAQNSGLVKPNSAWTKNARNQMFVRALANLFRLLGDDFLLGLNYETTEMLDANGINYNVTDEGKIEYSDIVEDENN
tara:strand:- start:555 stop:1328 length:774 start_codon:yes stop_codon:yes gene_type:complete